MKLQNLDLTAEIKLKESVERTEYKHYFTDAELLQHGSKLAEKNRELEQLELDKKSSASTFKSRIEAKQAEAKILGNYLQDRYDWKVVEASRRPNFYNMEWEYIHPETGEILQVDKISMTEIKAGFPNYKDFESKKMVWYNPLTVQILTTRDLTSSEMQLEIEADSKSED